MELDVLRFLPVRRHPFPQRVGRDPGSVRLLPLIDMEGIDPRRRDHHLHLQLSEL